MESKAVFGIFFLVLSICLLNINNIYAGFCDDKVTEYNQYGYFCNGNQLVQCKYDTKAKQGEKIWEGTCSSSCISDSDVSRCDINWCSSRKYGQWCEGDTLKACNNYLFYMNGKYVHNYKLSTGKCTYGCTQKSTRYAYCKSEPCEVASLNNYNYENKTISTCNNIINYRIPITAKNNPGPLLKNSEGFYQNYVNYNNTDSSFIKLANRTLCESEMKSFSCRKNFKECIGTDTASKNYVPCINSCKKAYWCFYAANKTNTPVDAGFEFKYLDSNCLLACGNDARSILKISVPLLIFATLLSLLF